ncbi:Hsp20/alpha crystallin family protein [Saccharopolyspora phatthalungensis]|uniref:HSP20 family protein n=1 Tax=Saccharopolyspora phatthalungensis TaxID=664693 RepID=A0A840QF19_9PSEU|nr:Hsp20/alpha crystallin family protein [Saccharopolyspora phatthalungensis]MBB5157288.1 HSP20 family protein [Saccharopolyspora phatthalungensis]
MLMRAEPAPWFDRSAWPGTWSQPVPLAVDVVRAAEEFVVMADLPGVSADAVDIDATATTLTVRAERRPPQFGAGERLCASERRLGVAAQHLVFDEPVDVQRVNAVLDAGVLTIRLPLANRTTRRRITITTTGTTTAGTGTAGTATAAPATAAPAGERPEDGAA